MGLSWRKMSSLCSRAGSFADRCCDICCQLCLEGCCGACAHDCRYTFWFMCTRLANYCLAFTSSEEPQRAHHIEDAFLNGGQGEKEDSTEPCEAGAGTLAMEEDYMKQGYPDVVRQQHTSNVARNLHVWHVHPHVDVDFCTLMNPDSILAAATQNLEQMETSRLWNFLGQLSNTPLD
ncbi:hypothetical protein MHYP_G00154480 [Metynnis hypsauchen]